MPTFKKTKNKQGISWRVQIMRGGKRYSKCFPTKAEAETWAEDVAHEVRTGKRKYATANLVSDALARYAEKVSPRHRGHKWERNRINALRRAQFAHKPIERVKAGDIAEWRDMRLESVLSSSVNRDLKKLPNVMDLAKVTGHRDLKVLLRTYYHPSASDLAAKLR